MPAQPTSTGGKLVPTPEPGVYRRDGRFIVRWNEEGRRHRRSFATIEEAVTFRDEYVRPYRARPRGVAPSAVAPVRRDTGWVYFAQDANGLVKIGWSRDPASRLQALGAGHPVGLELAALVPGSRTLEAHLHRAFREHNLSGEWFDREVLDLLVARIAQR